MRIPLPVEAGSPLRMIYMVKQMLYSRVYIDSFGYEMAPNVVTSEDIENRLIPLYDKLHLQKGMLESLTGIYERRFWNPGYSNYEGALKAGAKALNASGIPKELVGMLLYCGVCRDNLEPATACAVCDGLGLSDETLVYDVSNACLGVLNGIIQVANAIELGQVKAGLVTACESARDIIDFAIDYLLKTKNMEIFKKRIATLTGGSGAVAVLLTDASVSGSGHRLLGGVAKNSTRYHELCRWGSDKKTPLGGLNIMETDSIGILQHGVSLGSKTFEDLKKEMSWPDDKPDKIICHQVGATHQKTILKAIGIDEEKDFTTFQYLGNIGSVSLPITAAIASEREFINSEDMVGFLGIGSGLNCIMLGIKW